MEPINMIIMYYSDKKLPKRLHFLETDMITIKKTEDLRSAQRIHLLEHMFQMTAVVPQTHLKPTSEVVNHPDTFFLPDGTNLLGDGHFHFTNGLRTILIHVVLQELPEIKIWCLRRNGSHLEHVL